MSVPTFSHSSLGCESNDVVPCHIDASGRSGDRSRTKPAHLFVLGHILFSEFIFRTGSRSSLLLSGSLVLREDGRTFR